MQGVAIGKIAIAKVRSQEIHQHFHAVVVNAAIFLIDSAAVTQSNNFAAVKFGRGIVDNGQMGIAFDLAHILDGFAGNRFPVKDRHIDDGLGDGIVQFGGPVRAGNCWPKSADRPRISMAAQSYQLINVATFAAGLQELFAN